MPIIFVFDNSPCYIVGYDNDTSVRIHFGVIYMNDILCRILPATYDIMHKYEHRTHQR